MSNLIRWTPSQELLAMQKNIDRMLNGALSGLGQVADTHNTLALDMSENDNAFTLIFNVPGIAPEDIEVTINDNILAVVAEISQDTSEEDNGKILLQERRYGKFSRRLTLPRGIDTENIDSEYENGVLTLILPKTEVAQKRRIEIRTTRHTGNN